MPKFTAMDLFIYPLRETSKMGGRNPYVSHLASGLAKRNTIVNSGTSGNYGFLDIFRWFGQIDIAIFNWAEDLPERRYGFFQSLLFPFLLWHLKRKGVGIIWIMHNKVSHRAHHLGLKLVLRNHLLRSSDQIWAHSTEAIPYLRQCGVKEKIINKVKYFPHPFTEVRPVKLLPENELLYEVLIWGGIAPYKGIREFLQELQIRGMQDSFRIKIIGDCTDQAYQKQLKSLVGTKTEIEFRHAGLAEVRKAVSQSKCVLFTYLNNSVLSSGLLIDSISMNARILAPHIGAFKDFKELGVVETYLDYQDLIDQLQSILEETIAVQPPIERLMALVHSYSWEKFAERIISSANPSIAQMYKNKKG